MVKCLWDTFGRSLQCQVFGLGGSILRLFFHCCVSFYMFLIIPRFSPKNILRCLIMMYFIQKEAAFRFKWKLKSLLKHSSVSTCPFIIKLMLIVNVTNYRLFPLYFFSHFAHVALVSDSLIEPSVYHESKIFNNYDLTCWNRISLLILGLGK